MSALNRQKINLAAREFRETPFEAFTRIRELGPVVPARIPLIGNVWLTTTYQAVADSLKNDQLFCRDPKNAKIKKFSFMTVMPLLFRRMADNMVAKDEPDHRRLRSLVDQAFNRQEIGAMRPRVEEIVDAHLSGLEGAARETGRADIIERLARPVPLAVICELLGLPAEDRPRFTKWFSSFSHLKSIAGLWRIIPGMWKLQAYLEKQFKIVRENPRPGLMSALVQAEENGDRLNDSELLSMVLLLLIAGHETTVHLASTSVLTMLQMDNVRAELESDWSKLDAAIDEMLRYNAIVQFAKPRFVTQDTEFHGQKLKRGELVMPMLASANFDPDRFENPSEFQIDRPKNYHMTFGFGPHVCLGMKLAKLETQVMLERLFTRFPKLSAAFPLDKPDWSSRMGMRSLSTLMVSGLESRSNAERESSAEIVNV